MADTLSMYQYSGLAQEDSIRLLLLQPGLPGSDIHCSLIHTTLSECNEDIFHHYTALSYVWGDATQSRIIFINGKKLQVTVNLASALDDLRDAQKVLRLWADAVCIDQSHITERNHQVGLMRDIYSIAQHTIIYLGKSNDECDEVMTAARLGRLDLRLEKLAEKQILARSWFTRVWIYQELILSKDPWIQCGRQRLRWDILYAAIISKKLDSTSNKRSNSDNDEITASQTTNKNTLQKLFHDMDRARRLPGRQPPTFRSVLLSRKGFGVSDFRDLVYGNLAVIVPSSNEASHPFLAVNYQKSVAEVFTEASVYILMEKTENENFTKRYEILLNVDVYNPDQRIKGLPSWVPDWSLKPTAYFPTLPSLGQGLRMDEVAGAVAGCPAPKICSIRCIRIDTVEIVSSVIPTAVELDMLPEIRELKESLEKSNPSSASTNDKAYKLVQTLLQTIFPEITQQDIRDLSRDLSLYQNFQTLNLVSSRKDSAKLLLEYFMRYIINIDTYDLIAGRKVVKLSRGGFGFAPPTTKYGDEIVAFCSDQKAYALVLRPYLDESLHNTFQAEIKLNQIASRSWSNFRQWQANNPSFLSL